MGDQIREAEVTRPTLSDLYVGWGRSGEPKRDATPLDLAYALGLVVDCDTCDGDGEFGWDDSDAAHPHNYGTSPCPDCRGGVQLNPEKVEAAAKAFNGTRRDVKTREQVQSPWQGDIEDMSEALWAFLGETK